MDVAWAGTTISSKSCVKYIVGLELDQTLSGDQIADKIISKSSAKLKFLYRQAKHFDLQTKRLLTSALIQCHMDYASSSWYSGLTKTNKGRLQIMQNKIIRFLLNAPPRAHIGPDQFRQVNMLPVQLRVQQLKLNHMYNIVNNNAPDYMSASVSINSSGHNTRSSTLSLVIPQVKSYGATSFSYTGVKCWNSLPSQVRTCNSKLIFKNRVKQFLYQELATQESSQYIYF